MSNEGLEVRQEVMWFAERMEQKLRLNDHKGGWRDLSFYDLFSSLAEEMLELRIELSNFSSRKDGERVIDEAVDVANFALMITDKATVMMEGGELVDG